MFARCQARNGPRRCAGSRYRRCGDLWRLQLAHRPCRAPLRVASALALASTPMRFAAGSCQTQAPRPSPDSRTEAPNLVSAGALLIDGQVQLQGIVGDVFHVARGAGDEVRARSRWRVARKGFGCGSFRTTFIFNNNNDLGEYGHAPTCRFVAYMRAAEPYVQTEGAQAVCSS